MPFLKRPIGGGDRAIVLVTPADQLEQQISVPVGIRQMRHLINQQQVKFGNTTVVLSKLALLQPGQLAEFIGKYRDTPQTAP